MFFSCIDKGENIVMCILWLHICLVLLLQCCILRALVLQSDTTYLHR